MTDMLAETRTGVLRLRATFESDRLTILDAQDALFGLGGMIYVVHLLALAETLEWNRDPQGGPS